MPITEDQKNEALREFIKDLYVDLNTTANMTTDDIKAAVTSMVVFIENNAAAINNNIPEPAKSNATNAEKRYILALAAMKLAGL